MSTAPQAKKLLTAEEYLAQERLAPYKSEYFQGEVFAMAGASRQHNRIAVNLYSAAHAQLKDGRCEIYPSALRVKVSATGLYAYPDATIVCEDAQFEDEHLDTLLNPLVIFEILSSSTDSYDRGFKSFQYRQLPSLKEFIIIAQDRPLVEHYHRQKKGTWQMIELTKLSEALKLVSVPVTIPLRVLYARVEFKKEKDKP